MGLCYKFITHVNFRYSGENLKLDPRLSKVQVKFAKKTTHHKTKSYVPFHSFVSALMVSWSLNLYTYRYVPI